MEKLTGTQCRAELGLWACGRAPLMHYSAKPIGKLKCQRQEIGPKPCGLWVSVPGPDDWPSWCRSEQFALDRLLCTTSVEVAVSAKILHLASAWAIDVFTHQFGVSSPWERSDRYSSIDWPNVAKTWDGIIISPYQWSRRLDGAARWYYGWDCASGCIWNAKTISVTVPASHLTPTDRAIALAEREATP